MLIKYDWKYSKYEQNMTLNKLNMTKNVPINQETVLKDLEKF